MSFKCRGWGLTRRRLVQGLAIVCLTAKHTQNIVDHIVVGFRFLCHVCGGGGRGGGGGVESFLDSNGSFAATIHNFLIFLILPMLVCQLTSMIIPPFNTSLLLLDVC